MGSSNEINNNYWLDTCGATYGILIDTLGSNDGAESKTDVELKSLANTLGEAYTTDEKGLNQGYPYLINNKP